MHKPLRRIWMRRNSGGLYGRSVPVPAVLQVLLSVVLGVGLALLTIRSFDSRVRPIINAMARTSIENAVIQIVNNAVNDTLLEQGIAYHDMVTIQKDNSGHITALTTNSAEMNRLRATLVDDIISQVNNLDTDDLGVPLGNLTSFSTLAGKGPLLPVRVLSVGTPAASFRNVFAEAAINQSHHRIMLDVTVTIKLLIPGGTVETSVSTEVCIAETIIVGQVPDAYLQFGTQTQ